jgi:NAD(P)-dependent dehydrogenase (short-subunit alcohol dehydrogenase family)
MVAMDAEHNAQRVALVAGATRGAGRAIAVELARAGLYVYATGRSSRAAGSSERAAGRPRWALGGAASSSYLLLKKSW